MINSCDKCGMPGATKKIIYRATDEDFVLCDDCADGFRSRMELHVCLDVRDSPHRERRKQNERAAASRLRLQEMDKGVS